MKNALVVLAFYMLISPLAELRDGFGPTAFESLIFVMLCYWKLEEGGSDGE